jgi:multiple sugar transport system permease protein
VSDKLPRLYDVLTSKEITQSAYASQLLYNEGAIMAATLLVILPVLIIYFLLQKQFMEGIERSGIVG